MGEPHVDEPQGPARPEPPGAAEEAPASGEAPLSEVVEVTRRTFVVRVLVALGVLIGVVVAVPAAVFAAASGWLARTPVRLLSSAVSPVLRSSEWTSAGPLERLAVGEPSYMIIDRPIVDGWVQEDAPIGVYVVRSGETEAMVFDPHCTHLGCPLAWSSGSERFLCPCHGGAFDVEGKPVAGPPPHGLDRYETRVDDGDIVFRTLLER